MNNTTNQMQNMSDVWIDEILNEIPFSRKENMCNLCFEECANRDLCHCSCCLKKYCGSCRETAFNFQTPTCFFCLSTKQHNDIISRSQTPSPSLSPVSF